MDERDEVHEALTDTVRTGATVLTQIGAQVARSSEARAADSARRAERDARDLQDRATAARDAARLSYAPVADPAWWDRARPEQVADAYAAATAWRGTDPVADHAVPVLERELHARYGIDPVDLPATAVQDAVRQPSVRTSAAAEAAATTAILDTTAVLDGAPLAVAQTSAATPPATAERERIRQGLEQSGQDLPARAVEARLTAAYGEGRPATDIRASTPTAPPASWSGTAQAVRLRRGR